jgi:hypothetical protein
MSRPHRTWPSISDPIASPLMDAAHRIALGGGRYTSCNIALGAFAAAWTAHGGEIFEMVDWPAQAASWLRPARRLAAGMPDLWVVSDSAGGWAQMARRLAYSTDWEAQRTLGFAAVGTTEAVELVGGHVLDGMAGPTATSGYWLIRAGLLLQSDNPPVPEANL